MTKFFDFFTSIPPLYFGIAASLLILILLLGIYIRSFRRKIFSEAKNCAELHPTFRSMCSFRFSKRFYAFRFPLLKKLSQRYGINLIVLTNVDEYWIDKLEKHPNKRIFKRTLSYSPEKALFTCFRLSLSKPKYRPLFREWIDKSGEFMVMRSIAQSCVGRPFDGKAALEAYGDFKEQLYQISGDHEWTSRWFAYRILVHDEDRRSIRALWASFNDTSYRVRENAAELFCPSAFCPDEESGEERKRLYNTVFSLLLDDPEYLIRKTARHRIESEFSDLYRIPDSLSHVQKLHLAEFLNPKLEEDRRFAFLLLDSDDEELTFEAARILSTAGSLIGLFLDVFHEDNASLKRASTLLFHAARVHYTGFLSAIERTTNPGSLILATQVLSHYGDRKHITTLVQKVRGFEEKQKKTAPFRDVYLGALHCVCARGDDTALHLLANELHLRRHDKEFHSEILPDLPVEQSHVYISTLIDFLTSPDYPSKDTLRALLSRIDPAFTLPHLFRIIKSGYSEYSSPVQEEALKVLCELKLPYAVQHILEHLPILSLSQSYRYADLISSYNGDTYRARVDYLLDGHDARIRSRIISSLPKSYFPVFHDRILASLTDPDPEVRSAVGWSLMSQGDEEDRPKVISLFHDPIHTVRVETGKAVATYAASDQKKALEELLHDSNELIPVKRSAIEGLAESKDIDSIDILVHLLMEESELENTVLTALSYKNGTSMIKRILSHVKKADSRIRSLLVQVLKSMGESAETALESLVFDLDSPLREVTIEILEEIGTIDTHIRHLTNRDTTIRREAAAFLEKVGTKNAYRGLVVAAKDPDDDVRAHVVRALEALDSDKGRPLLEELRSDPDRRVRNLTEWALERYKAKRL